MTLSEFLWKLIKEDPRLNDEEDKENKEESKEEIQSPKDQSDFYDE